MKQIKQIHPIVILLVFIAQLLYGQGTSDKKPNFLVIVADDMGFSDLGSFGGEIRTPNIDQLASQGVRYTNFYVAPTCSPTRSMLMTGMDNHVVGLGNMYEKTASNQMNEPGYEGVLRLDVPTLPEMLKSAGYHTYMAGKWHLGKEKEYLPRARGFERSFAMLSGGGSYFDFKGPDSHIEKNHYSEDGEHITKLPKNYYATTTFTDKIISYIESNREDEKPFFAYLAHQAPHDPLMVPNNYLRKYEGMFDKGWDTLRNERLERMIDMGILCDSTQMGERLWYVPGFDKLKPLAQVVVARKMEVFAAVLDYMDMEVGRLMSYLKDHNLMENTYVIFFSDNGPDSNQKEEAYKKYPSTEKANWMAKTYTHGYQNWGRKGSWTSYGPSWAQVSATPFQGTKYTTYEGGIRSPLIVVSPDNTNAGEINTSSVMHVSDILPTMLELASVKPTESHDQKRIISGKSWVPLLEGEVDNIRSEEDYIAFELFGCKSLRMGEWKIVSMPKPYGNETWELYNIISDPGERINLALQKPDIVERLCKSWAHYAETNNVIIPNRTVYDGLEDKLPPRPPVYDPSWPRGSEDVPDLDVLNK